MKKILIRVGIAVVILLVLAVLAVHLFLDGAVKRGVETVGPKLTKVDVKLDSVNLSLLSGSGKLKGFSVGNPPGYKTPHAISVGSAELELKPSSLLADKVVIRKIEVLSPEITLEVGLGGNNLGAIRANVEEAASGSGTNQVVAEEEGAARKLQVDSLVIAGARVRLGVTEMGGEQTAVTIPDIRLADLGAGPEGITAAELSQRILSELEKEVLKVAAEKGLNRVADELGKEVSKAAGTNASRIGKGLTDLLKRNQ